MPVAAGVTGSAPKISAAGESYMAVWTSLGQDGSWEGDGVGKTYGTAIATFILQIPYNCLPIMQR